jgi:hypothetical protein
MKTAKPGPHSPTHPLNSPTQYVPGFTIGRSSLWAKPLIPYNSAAERTAAIKAENEAMYDEFPESAPSFFNGKEHVSSRTGKVVAR